MEIINKILAEIYTYLGNKPQTVILRLHEHDRLGHAVLYSLQANGNSSPIVLSIAVQEVSDDNGLEYVVTVACAKSLADLIMHNGECEETAYLGEHEDVGVLMDAFLKDNPVMDWLKERV